MRFSFLQGYNQSIKNMLSLQDQSYKTQNQISTGKRILTPADDPVASAILIQLDQEQAQVKQYIANANVVESRLKTEEVSLDTINQLLVDVKAQTISAGNSINAFDVRQSIAAEIGYRLEELVSLANAQDANGEYIFSGFQGDTKPFVKNPNGSYSYQGDDGQRTLNVGGSTSIPISDSGRKIFEDIPAVQNGFNTSVSNSSGALISQGQVVTQASYDANYPTDYIVTFTDAVTFDIATEAGATVLSGQPYTSGAAISFNGIEFAISGTPVGGDTFAIDSTAKQSIMTTIGLLVEGLNTLTDSPADLATLAQLIDDSLGNIAAGENNLAEIWSTVGARQNTVDNVRNLQEGLDIVNQEVISELRDLDYAEAISRLSMETFTLEAAQQSFTRVNSLSLFNFL